MKMLVFLEQRNLFVGIEEGMIFFDGAHCRGVTPSHRQQKFIPRLRSILNTFVDGNHPLASIAISSP
jgi:hypothetical protein